MRAYVPAEELRGRDRLDRLVEVLADRAVHAVSLLDPDRVVVDAGMLGEEAGRFVRRLRDRLQSLLRGEYPGGVRISQARGGEFGGALGAAMAVRGELIRTPAAFLKGVRARGSRL
jgi:predicted NBD/HSP70 family sugar kinase